MQALNEAKKEKRHKVWNLDLEWERNSDYDFRRVQAHTSNIEAAFYGIVPGKTDWIPMNDFIEVHLHRYKHRPNLVYPSLYFFNPVPKSLIEDKLGKDYAKKVTSKEL
jgi:hypothetical protein